MPKPKIGVSMLYCLSEPFSKMLKRLAKVDVQLVEVMDEGLHELSKKRVAKLNEIAKAEQSITVLLERLESTNENDFPILGDQLIEVVSDTRISVVLRSRALVVLRKIGETEMADEIESNVRQEA